MPDFCLLKLEQYLKEDFNKDDAKEMLAKLRARMNQYKKSKSAEEKLSDAQAADAAIADMKKNDELELAKEKQRMYINFLAHRSNLEILDAWDNKLLGLESSLIGTNIKKKGARLSWENDIIAMKNKFNSAFLSKLLKENLFDTFKTESFGNDMASYLDNPYGDHNPNIKRIAEINEEMFERIRAQMNYYGGNIGKRADYMASRVHDAEKALSVNPRDVQASLSRRWQLLKQNGWQEGNRLYRLEAKNNWINFKKSVLDEDLTRENYPFFNGSYDELLSEIYDRIVTSHKIDKDPEKYGTYNGASNLADKVSARSTLVYKNNASWIRDNELYGTGSLQTAIVKTFDSAASNIAAFKRYGTNPDLEIKKLINYAYSHDVKNNMSKIGTLNKEQTRIQQNYENLRGYYNLPANANMARIFRNIRAWISMSKLGGMFISSFGDIASSAAALRSHDIGFFQRYYIPISSVLGRLSKSEKDQLGTCLNIWSNSAIGDVVSRMNAIDSPQGTFSKVFQTYFKLTGMHYWDQSLRVGVTSSLSRYLAKMRNSSFSSIPKGFSNVLKLYGIEEKEWDLLRNTDNIEKIGKEYYMTPDVASKLTDESIKEYLGNSNATSREIFNVKNDLEEKLQTYFLDQSYNTSIQAGSRERTSFMGSNQSGTAFGEFISCIAQFKSFNLAYLNRTWGRILKGDKERGIDISGNAVKGLVEFMVASTAMGYISLSGKSIMRGLSPPLLNGDYHHDWAIWMKSILQGGAMGIYGDFLFNSSDRYGHSALEDLLGPTFGVASDLYSFGIKARDSVTSDSDKSSSSLERSAIELAENNTPFLNLFFLRTAIDYLFLNSLADKVNPGSVKRMQDRVQQQTGQKYFLPPTSYVKY